MSLKHQVRMLVAAVALTLSQSTMAADPFARPLSLSQAEETAMRNHPRIMQAELAAMVAREQIIQQRSVFFPSIFGHATAAGAADPNNTRIAAGALNNPAIYDRNAEGLEVRQLITDLGHSRNLLESSKLRSRAEEQGALATTAQVLIQLDAAYFGVLQALAVEQVARQTITNRQLLFDYVSVLATNKLRSQLDVSFARVGLEDAKLLLSRSENDLAAGRATLTLLLGEHEQTNYTLAEEPLPPDLREDASVLVQEALNRRPEAAQARYEEEAARRFARAERDLRYPVISVFAAGGVIPVHGSQFQNDYGAAGVDLSLPIFTGGLYASRARAAVLESSRAAENVRDVENSIVREVRVSYQNAVYLKEKLDETAQLLISTGQALDLATARYKSGLGSIIEISQAQLNETAAQIQRAAATYDYLTQRSILELQTGRLPPLAGVRPATHDSTRFRTPSPGTASKRNHRPRVTTARGGAGVSAQKV